MIPYLLEWLGFFFFFNHVKFLRIGKRKGQWISDVKIQILSLDVVPFYEACVNTLEYHAWWYSKVNQFYLGISPSVWRRSSFIYSICLFTFGVRILDDSRNFITSPCSLENYSSNIVLVKLLFIFVWGLHDWEVTVRATASQSEVCEFESWPWWNAMAV